MDSQEPASTPQPPTPEPPAQPERATWQWAPPAVPPAFGSTTANRAAALPGPRRVMRSSTALALAFALGLGSFGAGYALVHQGGGAQTATTASPTAPAQGSSGEGQFAPPGFGQDGGQSDGLSGGLGGSTGRSDTTEASSSAETGMVEITSKLENGAAAGTGMILTSGGLVVTNHHVVEGATTIQVTVVSTGQTYTARYLGSDSTKDVALLQLVGAANLTTVDVDTSGVGTGASVTAVGDAGGDGGSLTASPGTVTGLGRSITAQSESGGSAQRLTGLIQVDADLMPGDSGGALLNANGDVVGMNVAASSDSSTGFAIPVATVLSVVNQIENGDASGTVDIGYDAFLGIALSGSSSTTVAGVVSGGGAAAAGITAGDRITSVGGDRVSTASRLKAAINRHQPGDTVRIGWTSSDGQSHSATVTLGRAPIA